MTLGLCQGVAAASYPQSPRSPSAPDQRTAGTFTYEGMPYLYVTFVPGRRPARSALVANLHGCMANPDNPEAATETSALARREGFVVLYPTSTANRATASGWKAVTLPGGESRSSGDAAALAALTRSVAEQGPARLLLERERSAVAVHHRDAGPARAPLLRHRPCEVTVTCERDLPELRAAVERLAVLIDDDG